MNDITIPVLEYKNLIKLQARVEVFAEYVSKERYSISREECAKFLDFELEVKEDVREQDVDR